MVLRIKIIYIYLSMDCVRYYYYYSSIDLFRLLLYTLFNLSFNIPHRSWIRNILFLFLKIMPKGGHFAKTLHEFKFCLHWNDTSNSIKRSITSNFQIFYSGFYNQRNLDNYCNLWMIQTILYIYKTRKQKDSIRRFTYKNNSWRIPVNSILREKVPESTMYQVGC